MNLSLFFALLGALLVLAFIANRLVRFTRVPDVIILMATGVVIGPVLHWVNPDIFHGATHGLGTLALILILFEGGLELRLDEIVKYFTRGFFLSLFCYLLTAAAIAVACHFVANFIWLNALLVGAVLGCISSSVLLPVLQQVELRREVKVTLLVDGSLGDAWGVLAVTTLLEFASGGSANPNDIAWSLVSSLLLAVASGVLCGMLWSYLLPFVAEERFRHILTFAVVLLLYSCVHFMRGNDLVSVLVFGITLANYSALRKSLRLDKLQIKSGSTWFDEVPIRDEDGLTPEHQHEHMLTFHGELAFLLRTFFFVLLGLRVEYAGMRENIQLTVLCFAAIYVARFAAVESGRFAWPSFSKLERGLMVWFVPRGLITAVLGIEVFQARGAEFEFLPSVAFAVILLTNLMLLVGTIRARNLPLPAGPAA